ncbi:MAG: family 78 glycoside hydrolase catalytic domain [Breznakibacter sp.]
MMRTAYILLLSFLSLSVYGIEVHNLRAESQVNPIALPVAQPRFGWELSGGGRGIWQTGYRILVASSPEKLVANVGDLWDSGQTNDNASINVIYAGKPLRSRTRAWWKVKVWANGQESPWSQTSEFGIGLLNYNDWNGRWIGLDKTMPWDEESQYSKLSARYFRKEFTPKSAIKRAVVHLIGLGMYQLRINGQKVGNDVLAPLPTDYHKSVLANTYDVTSLLGTGNNALGVVLGNGRYYTMRQRYKQYKIKSFGYPKLLFQMEVEYTDGTHEKVVSNDTWKVCADGPIRSNNEYDGEIYDATKELSGWDKPMYDDAHWMAPQLVQAPEGMPVPQPSPNMKVMELVKPQNIKCLNDSVWMVDMGQNMAGWLRINIQGNRGDTVTLRFAERLNGDGSLYLEPLREAKATDTYICKGEGAEIWEPAFVYHGFRYVEVTGVRSPKAEQFTGCVVYDEMAVTGHIQTSDDLLNQIYRNSYWGIRSNYKGMPIDCPQRDERQPWMGDRAMVTLGETFMFDNQLLYAKWMDDIAQSQKMDGALPDMAPAYYRYYSDNMTWPGAYLITADILYSQFGDACPIKKYYASMKKWLSYMQDRYMVDYILSRDGYGDWCVPPEASELIHTQDPLRRTDGKLISTAYFFHFMGLMQKFAKVSGNDADVPGYRQLADSVCMAFNRKYYDAKESLYDNNTVTANLLPLVFGMVPQGGSEKVFANIIEKIVRQNNSHVTTGLVGTQWLMRGLTKYGRSDVAYRLATNDGFPGWGYMVANGATTIWELWNSDTANPKMNSHNHVMMLGDLISWMYEDLAGIKSASPGFKTLEMKPEYVDGLEHVKASFRSGHGLVESEWEQTFDHFSWKIAIPANTKATVYIPVRSGAVITENGRPVEQVTDVAYLRREGLYAVYGIGSGTYCFESRYQWKEGIMKDEFISLRPGYPESHAATIVETPQGLVASWFGGTKERNPDVCIFVSRLENGKWTHPENVAGGIVSDTLRYPTWNPVLYQVPKGPLWLFYKVGPNVPGWKGYYLTSVDHGKTWSAPTALPDGFLGPIKNKPVLVGKNTLICPSSTEGNGWRVHFEVTRDWGKTWEIIGPINNPESANVIQPSVLTYKDGRMQVVCRSRNRAVMESWSADGGKTWSEMVPTSLPNNNSGTDAVTLRDGRQLLVYNHVLPPEGQSKGSRTPLNVAVSGDGKTWDACLVLEDSPIGQYSYPSVIQTRDGLVHVVYTWRRERIKHVVIDPRKLKPVAMAGVDWPMATTDKQ